MIKPTIYEVLHAKLGRTPTNAELKAEVDRIKKEALVDLAGKGKLPFQRGQKQPTKKKSPAQLQREIDAVLAGKSGSASTRVPCSCGSTDASWHGPEDGLRVYACDRCRRKPQTTSHATRTSAGKGARSSPGRKSLSTAIREAAAELGVSVEMVTDPTGHGRLMYSIDGGKALAPGEAADMLGVDF